MKWSGSASNKKFYENYDKMEKGSVYLTIFVRLTMVCFGIRADQYRRKQMLSGHLQEIAIKTCGSKPIPAIIKE